MPDENIQLEKVLTEVLLEIRFSGAPDVSLLVGKMHEALQEEYPVYENLNIPDLPKEFPNVEKVVRYRIYSEDRSKLYNLGQGVLSINTVNYSKFDNFMVDAKVVLEKYKEISSINTIDRIGLRYINKIDMNSRAYEDLFRIKFDLPETLQSIETGFNFQSLGRIDNNIFITKFLTVDPSSKETFLLDFDYYTKQSINFDIDIIEEWATKAQSTIVTNFKNILTEQYYNQIVIEHE